MLKEKVVKILKIEEMTMNCTLLQKKKQKKAKNKVEVSSLRILVRWGRGLDVRVITTYKIWRF
jgi:hypothetical protein